MQHLLSIDDLNPTILKQLFVETQKILNDATPIRESKHHVVATMFFEPSTRTKLSFSLAAQKLGFSLLDFDQQKSSAIKGESLIDTLQNLQAMGVNLFVMRHPKQMIFDEIHTALKPTSHLINAGDGTNQHPTQALIDVFTLQQHYPDLTQIKIAIVGDIKHSRVAHSNIALLKMLGVEQIRLIGPADFLNTIEGFECFEDFDQGIKDVDAIMLLRIQKERMSQAQIPNLATYAEQYGLSPDKFALANKNAIILHPGPVNRNVEISTDLIEHPRSQILKQTQHGVAIRMALLQYFVKPV